MHIILIHGMGRTPTSMLLLRHRLRKAGHHVSLFGYSPTFESLEHVTQRLVHAIHKKTAAQPYALVGHSLGSAIIRNALPRLAHHAPCACFFLAPPMVACKAAKFFSRFRLYRWLTGEMGQLLAHDGFMQQLPVPDNTKIYAGISGPRASWLPFGDDENDFILSLAEACGTDGTEVMKVRANHTFIMNSKIVADDLIRSLKSLP